jgi:glycosyltransferase involved in cell wall biosynthesis
MKILVVQESDWIKRGPHQQHHLMEMLSLKGHEIRVIDYPILWKETKGWIFSKGKTTKNVSKYYPGSSIDVVRPPMIRLPIFDMLSVLLFHPIVINNQLRDFKPDIVVGLGILNTFFANRLAKFYDVPFVYYLIDSLHTLIDNNIYSKLAQGIEKSTLNRSDNILTINKSLRDYAIELGSNQKVVGVIPAGIDIKKFQKTETRDSIRKQYNIADEDYVLFFMGWLYDFSGLLEVADLLTSYTGDLSLKLMIVGNGDIYNELLDFSHNNDNIIMTGWVNYNEIPSYLSASDFCILPAYKNKIMKNIVPIKIYEYLASSKPVIATRLDGLVNEFGESSGILFIDNPSELISIVEEIVSTKHYYTLSKFANFTASKFEWKSILATFEQYLIQRIHK